MILTRVENYGDNKPHGGPGMHSPEPLELHYDVPPIALPLKVLGVEIRNISVDELHSTIEFTATYTMQLSDVNTAKQEHRKAINEARKDEE